MTGKEAVEFQEQVGFPFLQGLPAVIRALAALAFYGARKGRSDRAAAAAERARRDADRARRSRRRSRGTA